MNSRILILIIFSFFNCNYVFLQTVSANEITIDFTKAEKAWIAEHSVVTVTNEMNWAPMDFVQDQEPAGFSIDYLNLVARKTGLNFKYVNGYSWAQLLEMLRSREIDVAQSITYTEEQHEYLDFTGPYLNLQKVIFGHVGEEKITSISDLIGKRIGVVEDWARKQNVREVYPQLDFIHFSSSEEAILALSKNEIDVHYIRRAIGKYAIEKNNLSGIEEVGANYFTLLSSDNLIRLASRNDQPELNAILQKGMAAITDEEIEVISRKWRIEYYAGSDIKLTPEELDWLAENRVIRVASDPNGAPLEFIDQDGNVSGIAGAYLSEISKKLGIEFKWVGNQTWREGLKKLQSGEADIISVVTPTSDRVPYLNFVDSYLNVAHMIFGREGGKIFGNMDGLQGAKIVMVRDNAVTGFVDRDYPELDVLKLGSAVEALKLLSIGEVDAYIATIPVASYKIASEGLTQIVVSGETPYRGEYTIGVRKDLVLLNSAIQKAMISITPVSRAKISRDWLVLKIKKDGSSEILKVIGIALIIIAVFFVWNYSLRREVARRKVIQKELTISQRKAEEALLEAEAANTAKSNFLANISHEIRTPLNAIIGFSEVMSLGIFGKIKEQRYVEYLNDINSSGKHLETVINDILDLSKIEADKWLLVEDYFDIEQCVSNTFTMIKTQAHKKNIDITYSIEPENSVIEVFGDITAFKRILINLLSNSVKFTLEGGKISCTALVNQDGSLTINVIDNGIGIAENEIENVMLPFAQVASIRETNTKGTGLGLAIVKQLTELHGGHIELESKINEGTSVRINIPSSRVSHKKV